VHMAPHPNGANVLSFGLQGVIADGSGVLTPRNFAISIRLADPSYNSVSTAVLHCDAMRSLLTVMCPLIEISTIKMF